MYEFKDLLKNFTRAYEYLYECSDQIPFYEHMLKLGDEFIEEHGDFVGEFAKFRGDYISSDREVVAFAMALYALNSEG